MIVGLVQGIFEWLPISSEGNVALTLSLCIRTALSATVYYRDRLSGLI